MNVTYATITGPQSRYLTSLLDEASRMLDRKFGITMIPDVEAGAAVQSLRSRVDEMTKREASAAIEMAKTNNAVLKEELARLEAEHGVPSEPPAREHTYVSEVGMYRVGRRIFKVLPSRSSNRHYAKELVDFHWEGDVPVADHDGTLKFVYAKGAMLEITAEHRMSPEDEREFGKLINHCIDCGKLLTNERSIEYGKGPVCSDNYTR